MSKVMLNGVEYLQGCNQNVDTEVQNYVDDRIIRITGLIEQVSPESVTAAFIEDDLASAGITPADYDSIVCIGLTMTVLDENNATTSAVARLADLVYPYFDIVHNSNHCRVQVYNYNPVDDCDITFEILFLKI